MGNIPSWYWWSKERERQRQRDRDWNKVTCFPMDCQYGLLVCSYRATGQVTQQIKSVKNHLLNTTNPILSYIHVVKTWVSLASFVGPPLPPSPSPDWSVAWTPLTYSLQQTPIFTITHQSCNKKNVERTQVDSSKLRQWKLSNVFNTNSSELWGW